MRPIVLTFLVLSSSLALHAQNASCQIEAASTFDHSPAGVVQLSNRELIRVRCDVPARPFPGKPGESRNPLTPATSALQISAQDPKGKSVPSIAQSSGGGSDGNREFVTFALYLPLDLPERDAEAHQYFEKFANTPQVAALPPAERARMLTNLLDLAAKDPTIIAQHRTGHFIVTCRLLDGTQTVGTGTVDLEVLFKGSFSETGGLPGYWQASTPVTTAAPEHHTPPPPSPPLRK